MRHFWFSIFWSVSIFFLCLMSTEDLPSIDYLQLLSFDKLVHAILFGLLSLSLLVAFRRQNKVNYIRKKAILIAVLFSLIYGLILEIVQYSLVEDRTGEVYDIVANMLGCALGIVFFRLIYGKQLFSAS